MAEGGEDARASSAEAPGARSGAEGVDSTGANAHPLDEILHRAFSQISAEAFITDFVRQAIEVKSVSVKAIEGIRMRKHGK